MRSTVFMVSGFCVFFLNKLRKYLYSNQFGGWLLHLPEIFDYCPEQLLLHYVTRTERVPSSARSV